MPVGVGDDAAVVEPERNRLEVLSVDALVEGVHFDRAFTPPAAIGHRALAVNLSDLAAMGATPRLCLLSLVLPGAWPVADFEAMIDGLLALAARHRMHVAGGNLTRSPGPLVIDVTVSGTIKRRQIATRSGARAGDELYVTGSIGAAAAGLGMLEEAGAVAERSLHDALPLPGAPRADRPARREEPCGQRVRRPERRPGRRRPQARGGQQRRRDRRRRRAARSNRRRAIGSSRHQATRRLRALTGGDDYELLLTVRPRARRRLAQVTPACRYTVDAYRRLHGRPRGAAAVRPRRPEA